MGRDFWILAHPDDEIFGIPLWSNKDTTSHFHFFIQSPKIRTQESRKAIAFFRQIGISVSNSFAKGEFEDGKLSASLDSITLSELRKEIDLFRPTRIVVLDYEGGHQDHDVLYFVGELMARMNSVDLLAISAYRNSRRFPGFLVMVKHQCNRSVQNRRRYSICTALILMIYYKSQWRTWVGLSIPILLKYLRSKFYFANREKSKSKITTFETPLYEKRRKANCRIENREIQRVKLIIKDEYGT